MSNDEIRMVLRRRDTETYEQKDIIVWQDYLSTEEQRRLFHMLSEVLPFMLNKVREEKADIKEKIGERKL